MASPSAQPLEYRTALTQIERAIEDRLSLVYQERRPPVADLAALRAVEMPYVSDRDLIYVQSIGKNYKWLDVKEEPDNNGSVILPLSWTDSAGVVQRGRFIQIDDDSLYAPRGFDQAIPISMIQTGYVRCVRTYTGNPETRDAFDKIFGRRPAMLITFQGAEKEQLSTAPALYRIEVLFKILCVSYTPRGQPAALYGSDMPEEAEGDPGLNQILSDASDCLLGASHEATGYHHLVPGVDVVLPWGEDEIVIQSLSERLFIGATGIRVIAYLHRPDYDAAPITTIGLTTQTANEHGGALAEHDNLVLDGLHVLWPQATLLAAVEPGEAKIAGTLVTSSPPAALFPPSKDTYRDLQKDGTFVYQAVDIGADPPEQPKDTLRVGVTTTDATGILFDHYLCPTVIDFAGPDEITS